VKAGELTEKQAAGRIEAYKKSIGRGMRNNQPLDLTTWFWPEKSNNRPRNAEILSSFEIVNSSDLAFFVHF
jgi:hypothetical protein